MNDTLDYIVKKFELDLNRKPPIPIYKINRTIMAQTLRELSLNIGAEIGVAGGDHAKILCDHIPDIKLYCIDPWEKYDGYNDYSAKRLDQFYNKAMKLLEPYNCIFIRKYSMDAAKEFEDGSLDFVYIDGAHDFKNVAIDVCEWTPKVRSGGIVYGHDFKRSIRPNVQQHIKDVIPGYCYAYKINPWFVLGERGHNDGMYKEGTQSWMFIKT